MRLRSTELHADRELKGNEAASEKGSDDGQRDQASSAIPTKRNKRGASVQVTNHTIATSHIRHYEQYAQ